MNDTQLTQWDKDNMASTVACLFGEMVKVAKEVITN
jgi:hypothetical protein